MCNTIDYAGFGMACCYIILAWSSLSEAGINLGVFYTCIIVAAIFYIWPAYIKESRITVTAIFSWAIIFRLIGFIGTPLFEDDFYRYLWDGYQIMTQGNPYINAPESFFNDPSVPPQFQTILGNINYPEISTVYGPGLQFLFGLSYWIKPAELWPLKAILIACDLLLIYLLVHVGTLKSALLYAWNPLVIKEIAFTGHIDGLVPLLLISAWLCKRQDRICLMAILLGFAATIKIPAILFSPFLLWRTGWKSTLYFMMTLLACYLPFIGKGASDFYALFRFAQDWQFNSALYALLESVISGSTSRYLLGIAVIVWVACIWRKHQLSSSALPRGDLIFAGLIFASPTINPWYWLWVLPFSAIYPSRWVWIASFALLLSYVTGLNLESETLHAYQQPTWIRWIEFGIIGIALCLEYKLYKWPKKLIKQYC